MRDRARPQLRRLWTPAWVLLFLSPFCAEGLTGNTPPQFFFFPPVLLALMVFYGSGAILIRELARVWNKGWPTVLALGAAYGICEEGFATKVFFEPHRAGTELQLQYGTANGVHWPFTIALIVFHAVFAIAVPIVLTTLIFPDSESRPWVPPRTLPIFGGIFAASVLFSATVLHRYNPTMAHYVIAFAVVLVLIAIARVLPRSIGPGRHPRVVPPRRLATYGFAGTMAFWVVAFLYAVWKVPVGVAFASQLLILVVSVWYVRRLPGGEHQRFALTGGMLGFYVFTSFLLVGYSPLQPLVGGASWYYLARLGRAVRERNPPSDWLERTEPWWR